MITIQFKDRPTETRALAFLIERFSGRVLRSGEDIPFTVLGKATYERQLAAIRGTAPVPV